MQDDVQDFDPDLADLPKRGWLSKLAVVSETHGFFRPLGKRHFASHIERGDTLIVTFETVQGIRALSGSAEPMGWSMARQHGWSSLCVVSDGDTWFRDRNVFGLFDGLIDDGFFDAFETILFYGAGPCAYAAAAFSVAAPGARVVAIQPQATLDPRVTEWDDRFTEMRRTDFTARYGYAPDMLDACEHAYILYDPSETLDAMHAALFTRPGATKLRMRYMGDAIQSDMMQMDTLMPLLHDAATGALTEARFATLFRARRDHRPYLRRLMAALDTRERAVLVEMLARNVTARMKAPRFQRRLTEIEAQRDATDTDTDKEGPATL